MAHLFLQQDPKISVGDANDNPTTIPTPEELGSLLVTYAATGSTSQLAAGYAALSVSGTPQWVQIGAVGATGATGSTGATGPGIVGGTPNTVAKFLTPTTIGDSQITDNGTNVTITTPSGVFDHTSPVSRELFVASTGSDAPSQPGTLLLPLASVQEALRRLGVSGWLVSAFVTIVDTVNEGASPVWSIPAPIGTALPIVIRTTYTNLFTAVPPAGGTPGTTNPPVPATVTTALGLALNQLQGKILKFVGGAGGIAGTRYVIDGNDASATSTITLPAFLSSAPVAANTFDVLDRVGKVTWSGQLTAFVDEAVILEGLGMLPTGANAAFLKVGGTLVENATEWLTVTTGFSIRQDGGDWQSGVVFPSPFGITSASVGNIPYPVGITPSGCRYNGVNTANAINLGQTGGLPGSEVFEISMFSMNEVNLRANASYSSVLLNGLGQMLSCGILASLFGNILSISAISITSGRALPGTTAIIACAQATLFIQLLRFNSPSVTADLVALSVNAMATISTCSAAGTALGATKFFLTLATGSQVSAMTANTAQGGTAGSDISVDGGVPFAVSLLTPALLGSIRAPTGTFQHTTDNSAVPAIANTVNKFSGRESLTTAGAPTVFTITNSLARGKVGTGLPATGGLPGDDCFVQLLDLDATATRCKAVVTDNTITITFNAAPTTGTGVIFAWWLKKSTV